MTPLSHECQTKTIRTPSSIIGLPSRSPTPCGYVAVTLVRGPSPQLPLWALAWMLNKALMNFKLNLMGPLLSKSTNTDCDKILLKTDVHAFVYTKLSYGSEFPDLSGAMPCLGPIMRRE